MEEVKCMNIDRKKQLYEEYKNRKPEMGIISYHNKVTGEIFFGISQDTKAGFNRNHFQLSMNMHPNKYLQSLWNQYGEDNFECCLIKKLNYKNVTDNHKDKLKKLLEECFNEYPKANKI